MFVFFKFIVQFIEKIVDLKYDVGIRGNGVDVLVWFVDLNVEVVKFEV